MPARTRDLARVRSTRSRSEFARLIRRFPARTNLVAEGDSWFAYPPKGLLFGRPSNVISHLRRKQRFNLLQLSSSGDEAVQILSGRSKLRLIEAIERHPVHFLLFSGGGNDLVGRYDFDFFLRSGVDSSDWSDYLHHDRVERRIAQIRAAYADLLDFCSTYSRNPDIRVVTHTYDYAVPDPQGAEFVGGLLKLRGGRSWVYPYLRARNVPRRFDRTLVRHLIDCLAECLLELEAAHPARLTVADTRGSVDPTRDWLNEIHPTSKGFGKIAERVFAELRANA
jgi:hypothetical protein